VRIESQPANRPFLILHGRPYRFAGGVGRS